MFCASTFLLLAPKNSETTINDNSANEYIQIAGGKMGSRAQDSLALVDFFEKTNGVNWTNTWDFNQSMDTWFGVQFNSFGRVKCIDLDGDPACNAVKNKGNNIVGEMPDIDLPFLEHLFLAGNHLSGEIPNFSGLPNLLTLQLCCNSFSGKIPNFSKLPKLNSLELDYNKLTGDVPNFNKLPQLENLYLSDNLLSGNVPNFSGLLNVKSIYLHRNKLNGNFAKLKTPLLQELLLAFNQIGGNIPELDDLTEIRVLNLGSNKLTGAVPDLQNARNLREVNLSNNQLSKGGVWKELPALTTVTFQNNKLSFEDLQPHQSWLSSLENYQMQNVKGRDELSYVELEESVILNTDFDKNFPNNIYTWYQDGIVVSTEVGKSKYSIDSAKEDDFGKYHCVVTNPSFPSLELYSQEYILESSANEISEKEPVLVNDFLSFTYQNSNEYLFNVIENDDLEGIIHWDVALLATNDIGEITERAPGIYSLKTIPGFEGNILFEYETCNLQADLCKIGLVELRVENEAFGGGTDFELPESFRPSLESSYVIYDANKEPQNFENAQLSIVNQNGQVVFESQMPYQNDWTGMSAGRLLTTGVYFYRFSWGEKEENVKAGSLAILR